MVYKKIINGDSRSSIVAKNILGTVVIKGISVPTQFLLIPLTINYISSELYGIWLTLTSIIGWISFFDIGFGNGLRNRLAESLSHDDIGKARKYISTTYAVIFIIFLFVGILGYIAIPHLNWTSLLNVSPKYQETIIRVMRIVLVCFCAQMVLKVQSSTWMALQLNAVASASGALSEVICLVSIWGLTLTIEPSLIYLAFVFNGTALLVLTSFTVYLFFVKRPDLCPNLINVDFKYAKDILNLGGKFFIIQIASIVSYQMVNIILSNIGGPESVTEYNVIYKYVSIPNMMFALVMAPMWSAYTDAYCKGDKEWMMITYKRLRNIFCLFACSVVVLFLVHPIAFKYWIGDSVEIHWTTTALLSIYILLFLWGSMHGAIINGIGKLKFSMWFVNFQTICTLPLAYGLGKLFGLDGTIIGLIITLLPGAFTGPYQTLHLINGTAYGIWNK